MEPVTPGLGLGEIVHFAKDQPQYRVLPAEVVKTKDQAILMICRWTLSPLEREAIAKGEDFFLGVLTFGRPLQPLLPSVGPEVIKQYLKSA